MRGNIGLFGVLAVASLLFAGCAGPATFTIESTWQFTTSASASGAIFAGPCDYLYGAITVPDDHGKILGTGHVTMTDYGLVSGHAVCNVQFKIKDVPESAHAFMFAVPGYDDPTPYTRNEVDLVQIKSP